jgi:TonB-dependent SusC/RagA subfamily outer membrane receptor
MNDKPFYKPGESIWFSAWVTEGNFLKSTKKSQKLFVELVDPKGKTAKNLLLPIFGGRSNGDFELSENDPGGIYKIRAYTNYSKNFGKQYLFEKEITVQKVVMPRLLMKLDFEKKAYGAGDLVKANFSVSDLENKAIAQHQCKYSIYLNGEQIQKENFTTDNEGKAVVEFSLPDELVSNDGLLNIQLAYNGEKESISRSVPIVLNNISIEFYPEGGKLLANDENNVAFKTLDEFGKPADIEGVVLDEKGAEVTNFSSFYQGYGKFSLKPKGVQNYSVRITKPVGVSKVYDLPEIKKEGTALQLIENAGDKLKFVWRSEQRDSFYLVASVRDVIYYSEKVPCHPGRNVKVLKTDDWPFGIAKISLFSSKRALISERLVYVGSRSPLKLSVEKDKEQYMPGEMVNLKLTAKDEKDHPVKAKIALSVVDNKLYTFADDKQDNMLSYLLMSAELNEKIEEPLYYFNKDKQKAWEALDYVLMCSSLKRLSWLEIAKNKPFIRYFPDQLDVISGRIVDGKTRKGVEATVWLTNGSAESDGRSAHLKTTDQGYFTFFNVDPNSIVYLFAQSEVAKAENLLILTDKELRSNEADFSNYIKDVPEEIVVKKADQNNLKKERKGLNLNFGKKKLVSDEIGNADLGGGLALDAEDVGIEECVVTALGVAREKKSLGYAIQSVDADEIFSVNVMSALNGKVAGVQIINQTAGANDKINISIRGANTIANNNEPLYVVDGVPILFDQRQNANNLSFLDPEDISSITVLKDAQAQSLYGMCGANGVIIINTKKKRLYRFSKKEKNLNSPYVSKIIYPSAPNFSKRRRFDAYLQGIENNSSRSDFRSTLFWEPLVETNAKGEATVSFKNSDEVSSFKIIAEGISVNGEPGRAEASYHTSLPVYVAAKMPEFVCFADTVVIPLMLTNNTKNEVTGKLNLEVGQELTLINNIPENIILKAEEKKVFPLKYFVESKAGKSSIQIQFVNNAFSDEVKREFEVVPVGFPVLKSFSAQELDKEYEFEVTDVLNGSLQMQLTAYPNVVSDIFSGVEGLLREPYGCFEQTSITSYPNLLVMDYLKTTDYKDKTILTKAESLLQKGYNRLIGFETPKKGYEWFGAAPGHEALTAYGLMQFVDMKSVCNYVDEKMINRTSEWLLSTRDGKGNFTHNRRALHTWVGDVDISNAYIIYALSEAGYKDLKLEFESSFQKVVKSEDSYMIALLANAALNNSDLTKANELLALLYKDQKVDGSWSGKKYSVTQSGGKSFNIETTSLAVLAIMKSKNPDRAALNKAIQFLIQSRSGYGNFGSTQATILALKAITQYAKFSKKTEEAGTIEIFVNDKKVAQRHYEKGESRTIVLDGLEQFAGAGKQKVRVRFVGCNEALPYSLAVNWRTKTPQSSKKCKLKLDCKLLASEVAVSDVVRMSVTLQNTKNQGLPMSMIKIGIPGGLSPQPWQLKELRDKNIIDFYEIFDNYLVFYFRQMDPDEMKQINLDLKADMAGDYEGAASCAYLYYTDEYKHWLEGLKIKINE